MYLKSIEIQGFKSFANKIVLEFHDGITGIVGPNGSGKSNIADAVRWVLGEQSAKQLRGTNMQDVIFSGSEARKPLGFASVEITFDNHDHKLPLAYDEVSVARRVYRSGESEYLLNGSTCRLKDVQELFMDTGIGKEGYSIIGQGQIDKILSTKPEDRRELFDEAAGIVKFKKRKQIAEKNLVEAGDNLNRVTDIVSEIEKQIGPLERQSEKAREYLRLKEILKRLELNNFLCEYEKADTVRESLDTKLNTASENLEETREANKNAEEEYKKLEQQIDDLSNAIDEGKNFRSELLINIEKQEGQIKVFEQQLIAITQSSERIEERTGEIDEQIKIRNQEKDEFESQKKLFDEKSSDSRRKLEEALSRAGGINDRKEELDKKIAEDNSAVLGLINDDGSLKAELQRIETLIEQAGIKRSELSARMLASESEKVRCEENVNNLKKVYDEVSEKLKEQEEALSTKNYEVYSISKESERLGALFEGTREKYLGERSKLDSLRDLSERYEGYGQTVRKLMEVKDRFHGIDGVVAELITTEKKYETAVETALGASISHIVTEDEATAKDAIEYLKANKLGRATFLPITSVGKRKNENDPDVFNSKGVIATASELVTYQPKYKGVIEHLLKAFIVVDNIDNALLLAKKSGYNLRIVTLSGELLAPGGSIAGGAYKNNSNLLGRNRELDELEKSAGKLKKELEKYEKDRSKVREDLSRVRDEIEKIKEGIGKLSLEQESARLRLDSAVNEAEELAENSSGYEEENRQVEKKLQELKAEAARKNARIEENRLINDTLKETIDKNNEVLLELRISEGKVNEEVNTLRLELANCEQTVKFVGENIQRIDQEIERLIEEKEDVVNSVEVSKQEVQNKKNEIDANRKSIEKDKARITELDENIEELTAKKENIRNEHKSFFESWTELGKTVNELEKEVMRLSNQKEKLDEQIHQLSAYIWEEYELSYGGALSYREEGFKSSSARSLINDTKSEIKALGDVNVNSIEEYKEVSERYQLLSSQRDDLIKSRESILEIINDLDEEMRRQFTEQFALIAKQFNTVFGELFGGGKGELELVEDEDILEAGIRIIAQPPGKKLQNMMQLSGGEKALTAIALLFAIQNLKPSPFCLLDEIEAALDDSNVKRFASYLKKLTKNSQFIVITHRRGTMTAADRLYGITMQEKGVSTLVSVSLIEDRLDG